MAQDKEFVNGLNIKPPRENAPDFVKSSGSINKQRMIEFLNSKQDEWINFNVLESKNGNGWYAEVDNWKPNDTKTAYTNVKPAPAVEGADINDLESDIPW